MILFEETEAGRYASQGDTPPNKPGYNIWLKEEDEMLIYLGWCPTENYYSWVVAYLEEGEQVYLMREKDATAD